jgi:ribulose-phosphate 3-epimerase
MKKEISLSILGCDLCNLHEDIKVCLNSGVDRIHIDIFDGKFVPSYTFGNKVTKDIRKAFPEGFLECHLSVDDPLSWISELCEAEPTVINFHVESYP